MKMQGMFLVAIFFNLAYTQLVNSQTSPGCPDIDKPNCLDPKTCRSTMGGSLCSCRFGYSLDTTTMCCKPKDFKWAMILVGTTIGFLVLFLVGSCIQQWMKRESGGEIEMFSSRMQAVAAAALAFSIGWMVPLLGAPFVREHKTIVTAVVYGWFGMVLFKTSARVFIGVCIAMAVTFGLTKLIGSHGL